MEVETKLIMTLSEVEYSALKKFLGTQSQDSYLGVGLTKEQAAICSEIFDSIPYLPDDD